MRYSVAPLHVGKTGRYLRLGTEISLIMCVRELLKIETQVPEKSPTEEHGTYAAIWELPSFALQ
jgi:hypothetical protein